MSSYLKKYFMEELSVSTFLIMKDLTSLLSKPWRDEDIKAHATVLCLLQTRGCITWIHLPL